MVTSARGDRGDEPQVMPVRWRRPVVLLGGARRPALPVVLWRWRYEIAAALAVPALLLGLLAVFGRWWTLAGLTLAGMLAGAWPAARQSAAARAWCVITAHRVRTGCAEAYLVSRHGSVPFIRSTTPVPFGERVKLWCPPGLSVHDFQAAAGVLAAACWAREVRVTSDPQRGHLITLDVVRRADAGT